MMRFHIPKIRSIKNKIIVTILLVCTVTMLTGFVVVLMNDISRIKDSVADQAVLVATLIGNSCVSALTFGYPVDAKNKLSLIESLDGFESAGIFDDKGNLFAYHDISNGSVPSYFEPFSGHLEVNSKVFKGGYLYLIAPIVYRDKIYGTIYLRVQPSIGPLIFIRSMVMLGSLLGLLALAYLLAMLMQKGISAPIFELAKASEAFAKTPDRALHLQHDHIGEMGILFNSFNAMTATIHERQEELQHRNVELAQQRDAIDHKNRELEEARLLLEKKAMDLEMVSRYKSEFLANMSHELRTPLNTILMFSDVLLEYKDRPLSGKPFSYVENIGSSGRELLQLIGDILDLSKLEAGRMERVVETVLLDELMDSMERSFSIMARKKGLVLTMEIEKGLPSAIRTDGRKLEQILRNLLSNAIKFTDNGDVAFRIERGAPLPVLKTDGHDNDLIEADVVEAVRFSVTDTGIGIPEETQDDIFDAFKQVDGSISRKYGGTGLGLSISRQLADILEGEVSVKSRPGHGAIFVLRLPEQLPLASTMKNHGWNS